MQSQLAPQNVEAAQQENEYIITKQYGWAQEDAQSWKSQEGWQQHLRAVPDGDDSRFPSQRIEQYIPS